MKTPNPKFLILLICFLAFSFNTATAQTYDPYAVQVINNLIKNNGLNATPNAPETWGKFTRWNDSIPKQLIVAFFNDVLPPIHGDISFEGLTTLQRLDVKGSEKPTKLKVSGCTGLLLLNCNATSLTELNITNCTSLEILYCSQNSLTELDLKNITTLNDLICGSNPLSKLILPNNASFERLYISRNKLNSVDLSVCTHVSNLYVEHNRLTELDLTGLDDITGFRGDNQNVSLTLYENESGEYTRSILLNNPTFDENAINYFDGILTSNNKAIMSTAFTVQTGKPGFELSGTMSFAYANVGVNTQEKSQCKVYPNPVNDLLFIESENFNTIKLYNMVGKEVLCQTGSGKTEINISHLPKGVYIVAVFSEGKLMGNTKIVKQ